MAISIANAPICYSDYEKYYLETFRILFVFLYYRFHTYFKTLSDKYFKRFSGLNLISPIIADSNRGDMSSNTTPATRNGHENIGAVK